MCVCVCVCVCVYKITYFLNALKCPPATSSGVWLQKQQSVPLLEERASPKWSLPKGSSRVILITGDCHHPRWWEANLCKSHKGLCDVRQWTLACWMSGHSSWHKLFVGSILLNPHDLLMQALRSEPGLQSKPLESSKWMDLKPNQTTVQPN